MRAGTRSARVQRATLLDPPQLNAIRYAEHKDHRMARLALFTFVLLFLGPVAGVVLARLTGRLTWSRALVTAVICQLLVSLWLLQAGLNGMPRRVYGPGASYTTRDRVLEQLPVVVVLTGSAVLIAAGLTGFWHYLARRRSDGDSPPA